MSSIRLPFQHPVYHDASTAFELMRFTRSSSPVTGNEMTHLILRSIQDPDHQVAGREYADLKRFVQLHSDRLTPNARLKFEVYERTVRRAQAKGETGICPGEYKRMMMDMRSIQASDCLPPLLHCIQPRQVAQQFSNLERGCSADRSFSPPSDSCCSLPSAAFSPPADPVEIAANETARVWGDPHFEDPDGGKFNVQGEPGKTYNLLNDTGLSLNGGFDAAAGNTTVVSQTGLTVTGLRGSSQIQFDKNGLARINGHAMAPGTMETLADGGHAQLSQNGKTLTIMTGEGYTVIQDAKGSEMEIRVKSPSVGVAGEGRIPGGLLGQTFDADRTARNSTGRQGEGAIEGKVQDYEVAGGIFGLVQPSFQRGVSQETLARIGRIFSNADLTPPLTLPNTNPITGTPVDWNQSLSDSNLDFMIGQTTRQEILKQTTESNRESDKLLQTLLNALRSGNIDLAMLLFSSLESREASQLTRVLTQKLLEAQQNRRQLTGQLTSQDKNSQNKTAQVQANVQEVNDTIQLLTTFIRDVNDQKNRTMEFANNFLGGEHQTTMSIVRGMRA